jgi:hypothetical protein
LEKATQAAQAYQNLPNGKNRKKPEKAGTQYRPGSAPRLENIPG